jgi:hypothetical protein
MTDAEEILMTVYRHLKPRRKWRRGAVKRMRLAVKSLPVHTMPVNHTFILMESVIKAELIRG